MTRASDFPDSDDELVEIKNVPHVPEVYRECCSSTPLVVDNKQIGEDEDEEECSNVPGKQGFKESNGLHWACRWSNPPTNWQERMNLFETKDLWKRVDKWVIGYETKNDDGEDTTPHLQMAWSFAKKVRFGQIKKAWPSMRAECKKKNSTLKQFRDYCIKEGDYKTNIVFPRELKFPIMDRPWQKQILELIATEPDDRSIYWFWEPDGLNGKSKFCKYLAAKHAAILIPPKSGDAFHTIAKCCEAGTAIDLIVYDIPRQGANFINYPAMEAIKNGMVVSGKYEGGQFLFESPHIICFANFEPEYQALSADRWKITRLLE